VLAAGDHQDALGGGGEDDGDGDVPRGFGRAHGRDGLGWGTVGLARMG
jgi:hypothetical protein